MKEFLYIPDFISSVECHELIDLGKQHPKKHSGIQEKMRRDWKHVSDIVSPDGSELQDRLQKIHHDVGQKITEVYGLDAVQPRDVGYFYEYGMGDYYNPHVDSQTVSTTEGMTVAVRKVSSSDISSILYLNDDFLGGEIEFCLMGQRVKPKPGMLVLFYGGWENLHMVRPVEVGKRYCIVNWYASTPSLVPKMEVIPKDFAPIFERLEATYQNLRP
jgi:predicted 2-oxoglutarate/Fe(II)-dependent dioxygenase YbiX